MSDCSCDSHIDQSGFTSGLLLGLTLGAAGGYYFSTEKGQALLIKLTEKASDKLSTLEQNDTIQNILQEVQSFSTTKTELISTAREKINDVANRVVEATNKPVPKKRSFFSAGNPLKK